MSVYYNEFDPYAAQWLRNLIAEGHLPEGDVDERDMREVEADEIRGYTQHHFFAGIGGWSLALRLAGWPDNRPALTGSPPCQPFSNAGKQRGVHDERHLAPHFLQLVAALRPPVLFGEQVAAAINKDNWLDDLLDGLEGEGYTTGAIVLPACGIGAPHIRQRLWFTGRLAHSDSDGRESRREATQAARQGYTADAACGADRHGTTYAIATKWNDSDWLRCRDGKWRPVESGTFPLADGVSGRVGRLRAYGNAIVPQVAAEIIREVMRSPHEQAT